MDVGFGLGSPFEKEPIGDPTRKETLIWDSGRKKASDLKSCYQVGDG